MRVPRATEGQWVPPADGDHEQAEVTARCPAYLSQETQGIPAGGARPGRAADCRGAEAVKERWQSIGVCLGGV